MSIYSRIHGWVDSVFKAIADPGRRRLLDALRSHDGLSLGELCEVLPNMTRFGVSAHLDLLIDAGLVSTVKQGRRKLHYLNTVPLRDIQRRWMSEFTAQSADALLALRQRMETAMPEPDHVYTIIINTPRQALWDELTSTGTPRPWLYGTITESSWTVGDRYEQRTSDGTLMIDGQVLAVEEPARLHLGFHCHWDTDVEAEQDGTLEYQLTDLGGDRTELVVIQVRLGPATLASAKESTAEIYSDLKSQLERRS